MIRAQDRSRILLIMNLFHDLDTCIAEVLGFVGSPLVGWTHN